MEKSSMKILHKAVKSILMSVLAGEIITIACLFVASILMAKASLPLYLADYVVVFCACLGSFASGFMVGVLLKEKGFIYGAFVGLLLCVIMLVLAAFSSGFSGGATTIVKLTSVLLLSILGAIFGVNKKAKRVKF